MQPTHLIFQSLYSLQKTILIVSSDTLQRNNRRFHFELRQNKRGYFLKVSENLCANLLQRRMGLNSVLLPT